MLTLILDIRMIRLWDLLLAGAGLLLLWPLMLLIFLLGYLDTGSPIFTQTRVGREQKTFTLFKFRTMSIGTQSVATHLVKGDSVTKLGRVLRKTKLDELPQLLNVIRGDMSLVGPRPCLPSQKKLIKERKKHSVFSVRPGITGLAQVSGVDMSHVKTLVNLEIRMIQSLSVQKYFEYILLTLTGQGSGDRVLEH